MQQIGMRMLKGWAWTVLLWLAACGTPSPPAAAPGAGPAATITISCGSSDADIAFCGRFAQQWGRRTGHKVEMYEPPAGSTDMLALLRRQFAARSPVPDVVMVDVVWPGVLKDHLLDLRPYSHGAEARHFPAIVANNTVDGKLLAMPWFTDTGLLFYRRDLLDKYGLKPPTTWDDMAAAARTIQDGERAAGIADFQGFVFQAKAYEGLTCDALEWIASFGGGEIVDKNGNITIDNPGAARALDAAAAWVGTIAPPAVLNFGEEDTRRIWQNGKAAFMRNWPYAWSLGQASDSPIRGRIGVLAPPAGSGAGARPAATMGGWQLAVSTYSRHPDAAADLVMYLTSREVQKERAIAGSYNPTLPDLYQDKDVLAANPFMGLAFDAFAHGVARPASMTALKYPEVSRAFWEATHDVLAKKTTGADAVKKLDTKLQQIKRAQW